jgi:two-component sensor histidine kinase
MNLNIIKRVLFLIMLTIVCHETHGQTLPQATQKERLNISLSKDDTSRIRSLNKLGNKHMTLFVQYKSLRNRDSTFLVYDTAMRIANRLKTPDKTYWQMCVLSGRGESECYAGDTVNGRKNLVKAINFFDQHHYENEQLNNWRILSKTAEYYQNIPEQLAYLKVIEGLALKFKKLPMLIKTKLRIISIIGNTGKPDEVKDLYLNLVNNYKQTNVVELEYAYGELARYYRYHNNFPRALYYALAANEWMRKTNDTLSKNRGNLYGELAEIYQLLDKPVKSIEWFKKAIDLRLKQNDNQILIYRTTGFLVQEYIKLKKPGQALIYITNLTEQFPPIGLANEASLWQMKAYCYEALGQFDLAEHAYLQMMDDYKTARQDGEIMHLAMYDIGKFYINRKQYKKAAVYISYKGLAVWTAVELKDYHYLLFKIDSANKNYLSAINHLNIYKTINDSLFNATKSKQISELDVKYATTQKEDAIISLKKTTLLQSENIKQATKIRNWTFTGIFLLTVIIGLLYKSFRDNQKKTRELDNNNNALNILVTEKDALLQEKEWLMKEIHHRVKNNLQIVMGLLQRQSSFIDNKEALGAIRNSEQRMQSIALIHQKLYQSDSFMLVNMALYVDEMINYLRECFDLGERIRFEKSIEELSFEVNIAVSMGLILNEAITNAIKYAFPANQSGNIKIVLTALGKESYLLEIADDGVGLNADLNPYHINSMGFNLMRGLSKQLGGTLAILNDSGLTLKIEFQIS